MTEVLTTINQVRQLVQSHRKLGKKIALVPTMGALHDGHLSLVKMAYQNADIVIASIFVNPAQFAAHEDFDRYPRPLSADVDKLAQLGVEYVYAPEVSEIYPKPFFTQMKMTKLSDELCGRVRPGHFDGVILVVSKLFNQVAPDVAIFGQKDFQQLTIIKQMARDLDFNITILGAPTVREADGLAMSSRNVYLTPAERAIAPQLYATIQWSAEQLRMGAHYRNIIPQAVERILQAGFQAIDYCDWRYEHDLSLATNNAQPSRIIVAAHLGKARLLDNVVV